MDKFIENMFMNKVKEGIVRDFKSLDDDTKNSEFAKIFRERNDLHDKLQQYKQQIDEVKKYCEEEIISQNKSIKLLSNKKNADIHIGKISAYKEVLSKLKESDISEI